MYTVCRFWVFPKIGVSQNRWFRMENPIKIGWFGGTTIFGNIHTCREIRVAPLVFIYKPPCVFLSFFFQVILAAVRVHLPGHPHPWHPSRIGRILTVKRCPPWSWQKAPFHRHRKGWKGWKAPSCEKNPWKRGYNQEIHAFCIYVWCREGSWTKTCILGGSSQDLDTWLVTSIYKP